MKDPISGEELEHIVDRSRQILRTDALRRSYIALEGFPTGACQDASIFVGRYLELLGYTDFELVLGEGNFTQFKTHAWLESKEWLVDITADQFAPIGAAFILKINEPINDYLGFTEHHRHKPKLWPEHMRAWILYKEQMDQT